MAPVLRPWLVPLRCGGTSLGNGKKHQLFLDRVLFEALCTQSKNVAPDQGQHCSLTGISMQNAMKMNTFTKPS